MLRYLSITNLAIIEGVAVEFDPGLNVLTGETGAGKSIVVEAVGLLLGGRASSDLVRTGEDVAAIQAIFDAAGEEIIVRREITAQGRSRAFVNGALATAGALRELSARLVELHGQHEHQGLLDPASHLDILDEYAGLGPERQAVDAAWTRYRDVAAERDRLRLDERQKAARVDLLTFQRDEIARAAPAPGEDERLGAERLVLANAERLQRLSGEAYAMLYESDGAAMAALTGVWKRVAELAAIDPAAAPYVEARDGIKSQLEDLAFFLREYADRAEASPDRLQAVEDRLALLERLKRKYGATLAEVIAHHDASAAELDALASADARLASLEGDLDAARAAYERAAGALSERRQAAADGFGKELVALLHELAMERARFEVRFGPPLPEAEWGSRGIDSAEFFVSPNPGEDLRPLARIVSGGELSRMMLAIKTLAARKDGGLTLIFDEVDAGIGGRVADVVGRRLQGLGREFQVLCITHLPQIAAYGTTHFQISKAVRDGRTITSVQRLAGEERQRELARMIAGSDDSHGVMASAAEMLAARAPEAKGERKAKGESESRKAKGRQ